MPNSQLMRQKIAQTAKCGGIGRAN